MPKLVLLCLLSLAGVFGAGAEILTASAPAYVIGGLCMLAWMLARLTEDLHELVDLRQTHRRDAQLIWAIHFFFKSVVGLRVTEQSIRDFVERRRAQFRLVN